MPSGFDNAALTPMAAVYALPMFSLFIVKRIIQNIRRRLL